MTARTFRLAGLAAAIGAAVLAVSAPVSADPIDLRISHQWQPKTDARDRALRIFVEVVKERIPDAKFRIYPELTLNIKALAQYDALQSGTLEMSIYPLTYAADKVPEFSITVLPGAVANLEEAAKLKNSAYHKKLQEIANRNGVHILTWWWTSGGFISRSRPITGPDSVSGLTMGAADPIHESMLKSAGAAIRSVPTSELYPALQSGTLDAVLLPTEALVSNRLHEQVKVATIGGDNTVFMLLQPLLISKKTWDTLTPEQKSAFEDAATLSERFFDGTQRQSVASAIETYTTSGVKVRPLTEAAYGEWIELARKTAWAEYEARSADAKALLKLLLAALDK